MDMNQLIPLLPEMAIFVKVVDSGGFSKASIKLGMAPSSVSRSITRLENTLEEKLLQRTTRQMKLTATGQDVYNLCCDMMHSAQLAISAAQSDKTEVSGVLRVAAPKALSKQILMPMVLDFMQAFPKVVLQLKVVDHYIDPISDEVDVIIRITDNPAQGLIGQVLGHCRLVLCASPDYLKQHGVPDHPNDLISHNCLCLGENPLDRVWGFTKDNKKMSINVRGSFSVNHSEIRREAVLKHIGISVFPEFSIQDKLESNEVIEILKDWHVDGNYQGDIVAQYAQSKYIPKQIKAFVDFLKDRFKP
ncbi:LysR family transcriptional regulator [Marinomonas posidonica]|uniref:Transcriptional regulator, LysR family n=1 Tax=Marinomonas posidonica (strain CECT 7376 / NCIMB 14433 / IVIA-Po-181) TaxID=491952 RepID=F6CSM4_MARPP|nr:LysR family transcriptional regulator [Marinomonas posidonica]AEF56182.1 transcriptional regulator, LysR family [Marinomonas posidonica IVIA-Po-181]